MSHKYSEEQSNKSGIEHSFFSLDHNGEFSYPCKKVIIFGYKSVGKSSIVSRYLFNHFPETNIPDFTENNSRRFVKYHNMKYELELIDSPTFLEIKNKQLLIIQIYIIQNEYMLLVPQKYQYNISGYVFTFAKDDYNSFKMISVIREKLFKMNGYHKPCIIVQNKIDLEKKKIKQCHARTYADMNGLVFDQISAKSSTDQQLSNIFNKLLIEIEREEYQISSFKDNFKLRFMNDEKKNQILKLNQILNVVKIVISILYLTMGIIVIKFSSRINLILFIFLIISLFCTSSSVLSNYFARNLQDIHYFFIDLLGSNKEKKKFFTIVSDYQQQK